MFHVMWPASDFAIHIQGHQNTDRLHLFGIQSQASMNWDRILWTRDETKLLAPCSFDSLLFQTVKLSLLQFLRTLA